MKTLEIEEEFSPKDSKWNGSSSNGGGPFSPMYIINNLSSKNFLYNKLPEEPLKLTILKLDGSSFGVDVVKSATVGDLKHSVEDAFSNFGPDKVSWSHVWGNFCLCYDELKLLNDGDLLGAFGIKDGDQLHFIRHDPASEQPRVSENFEERAKNGDGQDRDVKNHQEDEEEEGDSSFFTRCELKLSHLFNGWFSYSKLTSTESKFEPETCAASSRTNRCCGGNFRTIFRLYSKKC
ncbi:hypothetical protein LguiA_033007 [Lonicera macranthoides]